VKTRENAPGALWRIFTISYEVTDRQGDAATRLEIVTR
jgi:hypothetical protein